MIAGLILAMSLSTAMAGPKVIGKPLQGRVDALVSIVKGMGQGMSDMSEVLKELDGSILELGRWRCTLKDGRCSIYKVRTGSHLASATLTSKIPSVDYRFLGTSAGTIVNVVPGANGGIAVKPQGVAKLIYKVERFPVAEKIGQ